MILLALVVPLSYLIGRALIILLDLERKISLAFLSGFVLIFASFQIVALPFMLLKGNFNGLVVLFVGVLISMGIGSGLILFKNKEDSKKTLVLKKELDLKNKVLWGSFYGMVAFQIIFVFLFYRFEGDDAFYIGISNSVIFSNQIFGFEPSMGIEGFAHPGGYALTGYEILMGVFAKISGVSPIILYHTLLPLWLIPLAYMAWYLLGTKILGREKLPFFMVSLSILHLFTAYSNYSTGAFLLYKSWQGKSSLANILIPLLFYVYLCSMEKQKKKKAFFMMTLILMAGVCVSTVGIYLLPVLFLILVLSEVIDQRSFNPLKQSIVFALPSLFFLLLYLFILLNQQEYLSIAEMPYNSHFMMEVMKYFKGNFWVMGCYLCSVLYFALKGSRVTRFLFCVVPGVLFLTFLNPLLMPFISKYLTGGAVYWRLFWLIPLNASMITAVTLFLHDKNRMIMKFMLVFILGFIFLRPSHYIFGSDRFENSHNFEKITQSAITVTDRVLAQKTEPIMLLPPEFELLARQYSGEIKVLWTRVNYVKEAYQREGKEEDFIKLKEIHDFLYENSGRVESLSNLWMFDCNTLVLKEGFKEKEALMNDGFSLDTSVAGYDIYLKK